MTTNGTSASALGANSTSTKGRNRNTKSRKNRQGGQKQVSFKNEDTITSQEATAQATTTTTSGGQVTSLGSTLKGGGRGGS